MSAINNLSSETFQKEFEQQFQNAYLHAYQSVTMSYSAYNSLVYERRVEEKINKYISIRYPKLSEVDTPLSKIVKRSLYEKYSGKII